MKNTLTENKSVANTAVRIAFVHHKGGTGKTTSCLNIAGWLARMNKRVLVIDLDPQGNATAGLCVDRKHVTGSIYDVLLGYKPLKDIVLETDSGVCLAPSSLDLLAAEKLMSDQADNSFILSESLSGVDDYFDYIFIDAPPGSTLLVINGMAAARNIIIPLDSGVFAYEAMDTLKTLVIDLSEELKVEINILMMLVRECGTSIFDNGPTRDVRKMLKEFLTAHNLLSVKIYTVPFSINIYKAQMKGRPISQYSPFSEVARVYKKIAKDILNHESLQIVAV